MYNSTNRDNFLISNTESKDRGGERKLLSTDLVIVCFLVQEEGNKDPK